MSASPLLLFLLVLSSPLTALSHSVSDCVHLYSFLLCPLLKLCMHHFTLLSGFVRVTVSKYITSVCWTDKIKWHVVSGHL